MYPPCQLTLDEVSPSVKAPRKTGRSGMSAACTALTAPNVIAAIKSPRIITLQPSTQLSGDYDLLTLINREAGDPDRNVFLDGPRPVWSALYPLGVRRRSDACRLV